MEDAIQRMHTNEPKQSKRKRKQSVKNIKAVEKKVKQNLKTIKTQKQKDDTIQAKPNDIPPVLNEINHEFVENSQAILVDQVPEMKTLIQPNVTTQQTVDSIFTHKPIRPYLETKTVKTTCYGTLKRKTLSESKQKPYDAKTLERLQHPIQPPARMGYISFLDKKPTFP